MRSTFWRATDDRSSAICAISPTPSSPCSRRRSPRRKSPPRSPCSATARAQEKYSASAIETLRAEHDNGYSRPDYGSRLRDGAGVLALLAEANLTEGEVAGDAIGESSRIVEQARNERTYTSTQENNWMVLAAEAIAEHASAESVHRRRQAAEGRGLSQMERLRPRWQAGDHRQHRRRAGDDRDHDIGQSDRPRARRRRKATKSSARSTSWTEPSSTPRASRRTTASSSC